MGEAAWAPVLERLVRERRPALVRYAALLTGGDLRDADDLVQGALVRTFGRGRPLREVAAAEAYVRQAVLRVFLDGCRRRRHWHGLRHLVGVPEAVPTATAAAEDGIDVRAALAVLRPRLRACVVLRYYDDLTVPEIAERLGLAPGTVKRYLSDAVAELEVLLGPLPTRTPRSSPSRRRSDEGPAQPPARRRRRGRDTTARGDGDRRRPRRGAHRPGAAPPRRARGRRRGARGRHRGGGRLGGPRGRARHRARASGDPAGRDRAHAHRGRRGRQDDLRARLAARVRGAGSARPPGPPGPRPRRRGRRVGPVRRARAVDVALVVRGGRAAGRPRARHPGRGGAGRRRRGQHAGTRHVRPRGAAADVGGGGARAVRRDRGRGAACSARCRPASTPRWSSSRS